MPQQNYSNHARYYAPHHFVFYPVMLVLLALCLYLAKKYPDKEIEFYCVSAVIAAVAWLSFMLRQHYSLVLQNRIVRLEMRLRYFELLGKRFGPIESQLSFKQIAALRFASDEELPLLIDRTLKEGLTSKEIKKTITNWQPDQMRV